MKKTIIIVVVAVAASLGAIFIYVRQKSGDVQGILARETSVLAGVGQAISALEEGFPGLLKATAHSRDELTQKLVIIARVGYPLKADAQNTLILAYKNAERDLEISVSDLTVAREILANLRDNQGNLERNHASLVSLLVEHTDSGESKALLREQMTDRFKRVDELSEVCDKFTESLGQFIFMQKQNWSKIHDQIENFRSLAQNEPEMKDGFQAMTLLLELSGVGIENVSNLQSALEGIAKQQKAVERNQAGLLAASR